MTTSRDSITNPPSPGQEVPAAGHPGAINPASMSIEQAARVLTAVGGQWTTTETINRHITAGAPTVADGRLNLIHYMAWLIRELSDGEN